MTTDPRPTDTAARRRAAEGPARPEGNTRPGLPPHPSDGEFRLRVTPFEPLRRWVRPTVTGIEHLPADRGFLLVGNHSLYGLYDILIGMEIFDRRGIVVRSLADRDMFKIPVWRDYVARLGSVEGSRDNCAALMRADEPILVFPGGSREVWKQPGQQYELLWGDRLGFVRMAIAHGYPIVPFASLGGDDIYDIAFHIEHPLAGPYRAMVDRLGLRRNNVPSFGLGWGLTPLPRPSDLYVGFGAPIETSGLLGQQDDELVCATVRDEVRAEISSLFDSLAVLKAKRGEPGLARRMARFVGLG